MAEGVKVHFTPRELCCAIWACNALSFQLIDDPLFKAQFGPCIPLGFNRKELSEEMKKLANKVDEMMLSEIGKGVGVLAVDGWTNTRHRYVVKFSIPCLSITQFRKMYNMLFLWKGKAHFLDSVELMGNVGDLIFDALRKVKEMLESRGIIVSGVVGDNASPVQNALARFVADFIFGMLPISSFQN